MLLTPATKMVQLSRNHWLWRVVAGHVVVDFLSAHLVDLALGALLEFLCDVYGCHG